MVTRDELLNECWGLEYFPESRTLDQHVLVTEKDRSGPVKTRLIETKCAARAAVFPLNPDRPPSP